MVLCAEETLSDANSFSYCNSFHDVSLRERCYDNFSANAKDINGCNAIFADLDLKDACIETIAADSNNGALCEKIRLSNIGKRNECYSSVALSNLDTELCEKTLPSYNAYIDCYSDIAFTLKDPLVCNAFEHNEFFPFEAANKDYCLYDYAIRSVSEADCNRMQDPNLKSQCIENV
jgi:hypothetical protein